MFTGPMPDITPAQIAAAVGFIVAQLVAFGVLDVRYQQVALSVGGTILAAAWKLADAYLRGQRVKATHAPVPHPVAPAPPVNP